MKFSTRATYGLRAIINLAKNQNKESLSLAVIAKKENISLGYLEKIFSKLKKAKIIKAERGAAGGYRLAREPADIDVLEIITALEGKEPPFYCLENDGKVYCGTGCGCNVKMVFNKVEEAVRETLKGIKLSELT
jgi:Rrf2 family protein